MSEHGQALQGRARAGGHEPVEERFPLGKRAIGVGVLAEREEPLAQQTPVAVLVVELTGQQLANLPFGRVRDPRGQQLDGAQLVVHALAHAVADLLEASRGRRRGIEADVPPLPEGGVLVGQRPDELARIAHGFLKTIGPMNASAVECVSLESMEMETAAGFSGSSP